MNREEKINKLRSFWTRTLAPLTKRMQLGNYGTAVWFFPGHLAGDKQEDNFSPLRIFRVAAIANFRRPHFVQL